jgi:hypothetical protein
MIKILVKKNDNFLTCLQFLFVCLLIFVISWQALVSFLVWAGFYKPTVRPLHEYSTCNTAMISFSQQLRPIKIKIEISWRVDTTFFKLTVDFKFFSILVVFLKLRLFNGDLAASRFLFRLLRLPNQDCQDLLRFVKILDICGLVWQMVLHGYHWWILSSYLNQDIWKIKLQSNLYTTAALGTWKKWPFERGAW